MSSYILRRKSSWNKRPKITLTSLFYSRIKFVLEIIISQLLMIFGIFLERLTSRM